MKKKLLVLGACIFALTMSACGKAQTGGDDERYQTTTTAVELRDAVAESLGDDYWPDTEMPAQYMEGYGLTADLYDEFFGEMPLVMGNADQLIIVKAAKGKLDDLEKVMNDYRDRLVKDTMQYPMNLGKIQASRVETVGPFVCFVQLGADVMDVMDSGEEAVIKHCMEANEQAIAAMQTALQ